jgi:glutaredoxin
MKILKKFLILFSLTFLVFIPLTAFSQDLEKKDPVKEVIILSSPTCPHCARAKDFLEDFKEVNSLDFIISEYYIANNLDIAENLYKEYNLPSNFRGIVPLIFVDDNYYVGFSDQIKQEISAYILDQEFEDSDLINLPFLGEVDLLNYSLPALAIILGIVDGFNVCSLGALVVILGLVMILRSRKRIFLLGGAFLLTTTLVYGLLIFLWHQFFTLISPYIRSMELLIGLLALAGGIYLLWEFYKAYKSGPVCSSNNIISRLRPKIEKIFKHKTNWFLLFGAVALFATVVTIIEFPCSAVLPVIFTSILVESGISQLMVLFNIALYILFYLLDELIIFVIAIVTLNIKIISPRFIIFFNLLAALIFLFLGVFYLAGLTL